MSNLKMDRDELESVLHWRGKHTQVVKERDALQQRLTISDQRVDDLESDIAAARELLKHGSSPTHAHCESVLDFLARQSAPAEKGERYECIGKGGDYQVVAIAQGAGTLKGFNHFVYKNADGVHFVREPDDFLLRMQVKT